MSGNSEDVDPGEPTEDAGPQEALDLSEMDPEDVDIQQLEEQEWTLGEGETKELIEFRGTTFLIEEPDDEAVLNMMAEANMGQGDVSDRMFKLCRSAITAPELTPERWREMNMSGRLGLTIRVGSTIGLNDMMDFQDAGLNPQQAESPRR